MKDFNAQAPASGGTSLDIGEVMRLLARRRWLLAIPWAVALAAGLAGAFLLKPVYMSSVTLMLERPQQLQGNLQTLGNQISPEAQADVMREQVKSSLFLSGVLSSSGILKDEATRMWAKSSAQMRAGLTEDQAIEEFLINYLRGGVTIRRGKGEVFQITVADYRPERAQLLAESVANQFIASSKASQIEAVRATQEFSVEQQQIYKRRLEESEARLEAFRRNAVSSTVIGSSVDELNSARARGLLEQATFEAEDLGARVQNLRAQLGEYANDAAQLSTAQTGMLGSQIMTLERQLASAQITQSPTDNLSGPRLSIVRKHAELEMELRVQADKTLGHLPTATRDQIVAFRIAQADLAGVEARRGWLGEQVGRYERSAVSAPDREMEQQRLMQQVENDRSLYNSFLQQSAIAQIAEAFENAKVSGRFVLLEPANRPLAPSKPNRPVLILLSLIAGGIIGAGTVLLVEHHDQSVRNADEIESLLGLPVIGSVPRVPELEQARRRPRGQAAVHGVPGPRDHGLLHRLKVESPLGLEFRRSYLKLVRSQNRQLPRSIVVTSSTRGEGKTTTTACLAITMARELRQKILLVDFDLRSPALHRALGLPSSSWGAAQMLNQRQWDERFVRATVLPYLEFLPAGKSDRPASDLIDMDNVEWFIREATSRYPLVILDAAPNLAVPDPLILGRAVDGVLYVIKVGSTMRKAAEYGVRVQRESCDNILGVLINDVGEMLPHYSGYRSNYGYGSGEAAGTDS